MELIEDFLRPRTFGSPRKSPWRSHLHRQGSETTQSSLPLSLRQLKRECPQLEIGQARILNKSCGSKSSSPAKSR